MPNYYGLLQKSQIPHLHYLSPSAQVQVLVSTTTTLGQDVLVSLLHYITVFLIVANLPKISEFL